MRGHHLPAGGRRLVASGHGHRHRLPPADRLITDALEAAVAARSGQVPGVIFHSDRGSPYTSSQFARARQQHRIRRSMSRTATSYDNPLAEAFFTTLKREPDVNHQTWASDADARRDVFRWIAYDNHRRRHSALSHHSPADHEHQLQTTTVNQPIAAQPAVHTPGGSSWRALCSAYLCARKTNAGSFPVRIGEQSKGGRAAHPAPRP
ncbi:integrase core domain-containing protein [Paractinoplanes globisporus]|uniref:Integrase core domain-containing protein n=1 Tax=Paractinoplanes globisporus TaxID=113565 RepID=A0ABW6W6F9_9ACTN